MGLTAAPCALQGREKINLIESFLGLGVNILVSDVDTVWCSPVSLLLQ